MKASLGVFSSSTFFLPLSPETTFMSPGISKRAVHLILHIVYTISPTKSVLFLFSAFINSHQEVAVNKYLKQSLDM